MRKNAPGVGMIVPGGVSGSHAAAIVGVVAATAFMSGMDALAKSLVAELHVFQIVWARAFFGMLVILPFLCGHVSRKLLRTGNLRLQLARGIMYLGANLCFFAALAHLPLADTVAIAFVAPLFITALSVPLLGESVGMRRWLAVAVGLCGAMIVIRPGLGVMHWAAGLAVGAAAFYALFQILTRKLAQFDQPATTLFYSMLVALGSSAVAMPFVWVPLDARSWAMMAVLGALGAVASFLLIRAYSTAPASVLAPFQYVELLWAAVLGFAVFGDVPDEWVIVGAVVIAGSGLYTCFREFRPGRTGSET